jgi:flagella basal body P-ring formation protein FlgA
VVTPSDLGGRSMVLAGDRVQVVAQLGGIEVSASGIALGGGDNGARLRVRNQSSGRIIDAMIVGPGKVSALP